MKRAEQLFSVVAVSSLLCAAILCPIALAQSVGNMSPGVSISGGGSMPAMSPPGSELSERSLNPTSGGLAANSPFSSPSNGGQQQQSSSTPAPSSTAAPLTGGLLSKVKEIIKVGKSSTTQAPQQQQSGGSQEGVLAKVNEIFGLDKKKDEKEGDKAKEGSKSGVESIFGQNSNDKSESLQKSTSHEQTAQQQANGQENGIKEPANNKLNSSPNNQGSQEQGKDKDAFTGLTSIVKKGSEAIRDTMHRIEDKAREKTDLIGKKFDEVVRKPMASISGSGTSLHEGKAYEHKPEEPAKEQGKQGGSGGAYQQTVGSSLATNQKSTIKDLVQQAKSRGIIPPYDPKNYAESDSSVIVDVLDKAHELSKYPAQNILRPIDKLLGYEKNPLLRAYDNSFDIIRAPLKTMSKPVDKVVAGAFTTVEESKNETQAHLMEKSEDERAEIKKNEEEAKKRSIAGDIADKLFNLYTKPLEILLKPLDKLFGLKRNPILHKLKTMYDIGKLPVDSLVKPLEQMLVEMAEDEELIKFDSNYDPKLVSRLADGSLNMFDRIVGAPMEFILDPLNFALGFNDPGKKNPIVEAAHELKNSSLRGIELFTRPIDRIVKEIADIGDKNKSARERELERIRQMQESTEVVKKLEKLHRFMQMPVEFWLKPVSMALGIQGDGKLPVLRAWDVFHELLKRPLQVVSKPIEEKFIGKDYKHEKKDWNNIEIPKESKESKEFDSAISAPAFKEEKNNVITDSIRKIEKLAARPVTFLTSPIRRIIMSGDPDAGSAENAPKNNQSPEQDQPFSPRLDDHSRDKILSTFDKINNVVLRPLEVLTQPVSDLFLDGGSKEEAKKQEMNNKNPPGHGPQQTQKQQQQAGQQPPQGQQNGQQSAQQSGQHQQQQQHSSSNSQSVQQHGFGIHGGDHTKKTPYVNIETGQTSSQSGSSR